MSATMNGMSFGLAVGVLISAMENGLVALLGAGFVCLAIALATTQITLALRRSA